MVTGSTTSPSIGWIAHADGNGDRSRCPCANMWLQQCSRSHWAPDLRAHVAGVGGGGGGGWHKASVSD